MGSKTISLSEEAYNRLARAKGEDESFSDVVNRLLDAHEGAHPLWDLVGLCDATDVETLRTRSRAFRDAVDARVQPESDG